MKKQLYIEKVKGKGRGVFCNSFIHQNEVIEICPLIVLPSCDYETVKASHLIDYFFNFNKEEQTVALVLGFGSIYNHTRHSNATYRLDIENRLMIYLAVKDIPANTEICINYAGDPGEEFREWFESRNIVYKSA